MSSRKNALPAKFALHGSWWEVVRYSQQSD